MGDYEVRAFLNYLAQHRNVSASTQNQALNALAFLYKHVIQKELGSIDAVRARRPKRLPVVLAQIEVAKCSPSFRALRLSWQLFFMGADYD